jgi:quercetin dioxygenase-like cupin family protein
MQGEHPGMMRPVPEAPRIVHIGEVEPIQSGGVRYRLVRRALGISAFGVNAFTADAGAQLIEEHDETGVNAGRHEELYVVLSGRARFTIDGAEHDAPAGTFVFIPDPESRRSATSLEDGTSAIAVGGRVGEPYKVSPWETSTAAGALAADGDLAAAAELMTRALAEHPDSPGVLYNLACFEALAGRREAALAHLKAAAEIAPDEVHRWAADDSDLDSLRDDPAFPRA